MFNVKQEIKEEIECPEYIETSNEYEIYIKQENIKEEIDPLKDVETSDPFATNHVQKNLIIKLKTEEYNEIFDGYKQINKLTKDQHQKLIFETGQTIELLKQQKIKQQADILADEVKRKRELAKVQEQKLILHNVQIIEQIRQNKLKQRELEKRELGNACMRKHHKLKQEETQPQNELNEQIQSKRFQLCTIRTFKSIPEKTLKRFKEPVDKLNRKRELARVRTRRHRKLKREDAQRQKLLSQNEINAEIDEQIKQNRLKRKKELSRECSRRYREKKRLSAILSVL